MLINESNMAQTVIGIFRHRRDADAAVSKLVENGVDEKEIDVAVPEPSESRGDPSDDYIFDSSLGRYFRRIFADEDEARRYIAVAARGITIAAHATSHEEAERIATLLDEAGALNIDEEARVMEDALTREERRYNLEAGRPEINPDVKNEFNTRESSNIAADSERQVPVDRRAGTPLNIRTRIVETPVSDKIRYREEQIWTEPQKHKRVDEEGNIHHPD